MPKIPNRSPHFVNIFSTPHRKNGLPKNVLGARPRKAAFSIVEPVVTSSSRRPFQTIERAHHVMDAEGYRSRPADLSEVILSRAYANQFLAITRSVMKQAYIGSVRDNSGIGRLPSKVTDDFLPVGMCNRASLIYYLFLKTINPAFDVDIVAVYEKSTAERNLVHCHLYDRTSNRVIDPAWRAFFWVDKPSDIFSKMITTPKINRRRNSTIKSLNAGIFDSSPVAFASIELLNRVLKSRIDSVDRIRITNDPRDGLQRFVNWVFNSKIIPDAKFSMPHLRAASQPLWLAPDHPDAVILNRNVARFVETVLGAVTGSNAVLDRSIALPEGDLWVGGGGIPELISGLRDVNRWFSKEK
ncbi:hypothetical protein EB093_04025 [bacterium]|nr:hypothetical protein [bacterium]